MAAVRVLTAQSTHWLSDVHTCAWRPTPPVCTRNGMMRLNATTSFKYLMAACRFMLHTAAAISRQCL